ncbi:hypothetical protein V8J83_18600 [Gymnodinialimonas sp. 2307UL20-7]
MAQATALDGSGLTEQDAAAFRTQMQACWNVGALPADAQDIVMRVRFTMAPTGVPVADSLELVETSSQDAAHTELAFQAARRAVIRCGAGGYDLPAAAFASWEHVEVTFDPSGMRVR